MFWSRECEYKFLDEFTRPCVTTNMFFFINNFLDKFTSQNSFFKSDYRLSILLIGTNC